MTWTTPVPWWWLVIAAVVGYLIARGILWVIDRITGS